MTSQSNSPAEIGLGASHSGKAIALPLAYANRHGLVTGATGTGKTVTLQRMAEQFSAAGVPVFAADVKGDLSGIAAGGAPVQFLDVFRDHGHAVRTSVHNLGPLLLSRMLGLNETQSGTLAIAFKRADDNNDWILDLDSLRWHLNDMADEREDVQRRYGNVTGNSIAAIQRQLLALESQGGAELLGEPPFDIADLLSVDSTGRGMVTLLHADALMESPKLYATLLLWLLSELFRKLPEAGDLDRPRLVFFFDEAHLLFRDAPKPLLEMVERVVRLVRSKGVGVYFVTQSPADVPDAVLAQLGNRIQHALRAYTPKEQRLVKAVAKAFRPNPDIDVARAVLELAVGEALVSTLQDGGTPAPVERVQIAMPNGKVGPIEPEVRQSIIERSPLFSRYPAIIDKADAFAQFIGRMRAARGLPPVVARPTAEPDWNYIMAPIHQGLSPRWRPHLMVYVVIIGLFSGIMALFGL